MTSKVITPWSFSQALEAAGIIHDRDRISEILIRCRPAEAVTIEVVYFADERIYALTSPDSTAAGGAAGRDHPGAALAAGGVTG